MLVCDTREAWSQFLQYVKTKCSATAFENWFTPIRVLNGANEELVLEVPNIFVQEYLLSNYKKDLCAFLPVRADGSPAITFAVTSPRKKTRPNFVVAETAKQEKSQLFTQARLNPSYRFENFIEGPANQFVKSVAMAIATRPGQAYNLAFLYGKVGLGKTHILHSIGHALIENHKNINIQYITTEAFINELVGHLKEGSVKTMKNRYREEIDVLLVDDIQFLQDRPNFQEEFACMFEALSLRGKQVVIASDKPPSLLKLSERTIGKMEGGLVVSMGIPDLETRVAILQYKAEQKGFKIPQKIAFYIAENIHSNIRLLEGAVNKLCAYSKLLNVPLTEELVVKTLREMFNLVPKERVSVDQILKQVSAVFKVPITEIKGQKRDQHIVLVRQVAMYLAKELVDESLTVLGSAFRRTHSTLLHAYKAISEKIPTDENLRQHIAMVRRALMD